MLRYFIIQTRMRTHTRIHMNTHTDTRGCIGIRRRRIITAKRLSKKLELLKKVGFHRNFI
jgi:pyrimidine operon attenuation protein/uracil phosphoribosyltransferase